jgi:hypothetical protein
MVANQEAMLKHLKSLHERLDRIERTLEVAPEEELSLDP